MRFIFIFSLLFFISAETLFAQQLNTSMWVPNGPVYTTAQKNNSVYIGGTFDDIGPATGHAAIMDSSSGAFIPNTPLVDGTIYCVLNDGRGGWYIGGNFQKVNNIQRHYLAHIKPSGQLDMNWNPDPDGEIRCMALNDSNRLFLGGHFSNMGIWPRYNLACIDTSTAIADQWAPFADSAVYCMQLDPVLHGMYVGGAFSTVGNGSRNHLARIDTTTGNVFGYPMQPQVDFNFTLDGTVFTLCVVPGEIFVGGSFTSVGTNGRIKLASFTTGVNPSLTSWAPNVNGNVYSIINDPLANRIYIAGAFSTYNFAAQNYIASVNYSGTLIPFSPNFNSTVHSLFLTDTILYAGGDFSKVGLQNRKKIAAVNTLTALPTPWNPHLNKTVYGIAENAGKVFAGGAFTSIGGVDRNNLAALDLTSGQPTSWDPNVTGTVYAIQLDVDTLYAAGSFTKISNVVRQNLGAVDANTAALYPFNVPVDGPIKCLQIHNQALYAGGYFSQAGSKLRNNLACFDLHGDSVTNFDPDVNGTVNTILIENNKIYFGGYFTTVRNFNHNRIACVNLSTSIPVSTWDPNSNDAVYSMVAYKNKIYTGGLFTNIGGQSRKHFAELDSLSSNASSWDPSPNNIVHDLFLSGDTLIAGGYFTLFGGQPRSHFAQYDLSNNALTTMAPYFSDNIMHVASYSGIIFAGGLFENIDVYFHPAFGAFYLQLPQSDQEIKNKNDLFNLFPNPAQTSVNCSYILEKNSRVLISLFDLTGKMKMTLLDEEENPGIRSHELPLGEISSGIYLLRLQTESKILTSKIVIVK